MSEPADIETLGMALESQVVDGRSFAVGQCVRIVEGSFTDFRGRIGSISDDGLALRVIISVFDREASVDVSVSGVRPDG